MTGSLSNNLLPVNKFVTRCCLIDVACPVWPAILRSVLTAETSHCRNRFSLATINVTCARHSGIASRTTVAVTCDVVDCVDRTVQLVRLNIVLLLVVNRVLHVTQSQLQSQLVISALF